MFKIWTFVCLAFNLYYVVQFLLSYLAVKKLPKAFSKDIEATNNFSIIVAMRNEALNLPVLLKSLAAFDYPENQFEIILVDDFSEDNTVDIARSLINRHLGLSITLIELSKEGLNHNRAFKKTAIQFGVQHAQYEWIVTTDADCFHSPYYLKTLSGFIKKYQPKFVSAPVELTPAKTTFQKMQALEFKGLVGLGAAYLQRDKPFLCNGANLAFEREIFQKLNGFKGFDHMESGDDVWFMHKVQERYPFELSFAAHPNLVVGSAPCENSAAFINQRKRWTAKNSSYKKFSQLLTLAFDYLFYCALLINIIVCAFYAPAFHLLLIMLVSKAAVELNFFSALNKIYKTPNWPFTFFITFPIQIVYVVAIYPLSQLTQFKWKNRFFNA